MSIPEIRAVQSHPLTSDELRAEVIRLLAVIEKMAEEARIRQEGVDEDRRYRHAVIDKITATNLRAQLLAKRMQAQLESLKALP